jgi:hypothetical protein
MSELKGIPAAAAAFTRMRSSGGASVPGETWRGPETEWYAGFRANLKGLFYIKRVRR